MDMNSIILRITQRIEQLGTSERAIALSATNSPDTIRNWRRKSERGEESGATITKLTAVAIALGMPIHQLLFGDDGQSGPEQSGFNEAPTPYSFCEQPADETDPQAPLRRIFGSRARSPATIQATRNYPGLSISQGDVLVLDLSRPPNVAEVCAVQIADESGETTTTFRRYFPPYLIDTDTISAYDQLTVDDPNVTIKSPVIGLLRGLPEHK